jgi:hypothetical protein
MSKSHDLVAVAALLLGSCDHFGGIDAKTPLAARPDMDCIARALRLAHGVSSVAYSRSEWATAPRDVARGAAPKTVAETWAYQVGPLKPRILVVDAGNSVSFNNGIGLTRGGVSDDEIAAYRPVIEDVNEHLSAACGFDLSDVEIMEIHRTP